MSRPSVLIVGAGPTGLILGLALAKNGVSFRIIEKDVDAHNGTRGAGVVPRTLETEFFLGVLEDIQKNGSPSPIVYTYGPEDPYNAISVSQMAEDVEPTPAFPITRPLLIPQNIHQNVLRGHLEKIGPRVEFATRLVSLEQDEKEVRVELVTSRDGQERTENVMFDFVVGVDGAKGPVRKALGIEFLGKTHESERMYIFDVTAEGLPNHGFHIWGDRRKAVTTFRSYGQPGSFQGIIAGPQVPLERLREGHDNLETLQSLVTEITKRPDIKLRSIVWEAEWRLNVRMADRFHVGRVFIAGDAAHVHSPVGGQGLNSSALDAFNLGWKIALVTKGLAGLKFLDSYDAERMPVIAEMLQLSTGLHEKMAEIYGEDSTGAQQVRVQERALAAVSKSAEHSAWFRGRALFQLDVNYRWSAIVYDDRHGGTGDKGGIVTGSCYGEKGHDTRAGDRAPDSPALKVLSSGGRASAKLTEGSTTRLFDIFDPAVHTILQFGPENKLLDLNVTAGIPVQVVRVLPRGSGASLVQDYIVVEDTEGHAYEAYGIPEDSHCIVAVRPDDVVGAFAKDATGLSEYFQLLQ